jgi:hypothetical protein
MKMIPKLLIMAALLAAVSCEKAREAEAATTSVGLQTLFDYRRDTRQDYNNRRFDELEKNANQARSGKERTGDGDWRIFHFYQSLQCREDEPESMWKLHDEIHKEWEKRFPESITARVARADFLAAYAWYARTDKSADEVTEEGWRLFRERLAEARTVLDGAKTLSPGCPMWWQVYQIVALGQGWPREDYDALFNDAKAFEPEFHHHDNSRAKFLLPRWYGEQGEWAKVAEAQIPIQGATGHEIYARVVWEMSTYSEDVFGESNASWRKARKGFDELVVRHPDSIELLNRYCRMACFAGDKTQARKLFEKIGANKASVCWRKNEFDKAKAWAMSGE